MSKYTTEVRFICEQNAGLSESEGASSINSIIENSRSKIFDFDFPMFDENYRSVLETKILKHYYTREIGFETVGLWKHFLDMRLNEVMPYYNQMYKSETLEFNPFYDFAYDTTSNRKINHDEDTTSSSTRTDNLDEETSSSNTRTDNLSQQEHSSTTRTDNLNQSTNSSSTRTDNLSHSDTTNNTLNHTDAYSDTPQGSLTGVDTLDYLTNYRHINESNSTTNNGTNTGTVQNSGNGTTTNTGTQTTENNTTIGNTGTQSNVGNGSRKNTGTQSNEGSGTRDIATTDDYIEHVAGKRNSITYSKMLQEYRKTFLNIDMMIIEELSDLFLNLW